MILLLVLLQPQTHLQLLPISNGYEVHVHELTRA
jgi:hypothetical protein